MAVPQVVKNKHAQMQQEIMPPMEKEADVDFSDLDASEFLADQGIEEDPSSSNVVAHPSVSRLSEEAEPTEPVTDSTRLLVEQMQRERERLEKELADMKSKADFAQPAPAPTQEDLFAKLRPTDEEEKVYGESRGYIEKISMQKALEMLSPYVEQLDTLNQRDEQLEKAVRDEGQRAFDSAINAIPEFTQTTSTDGWKQFLKQPVDPVTGKQYADLYDAAVQGRDAGLVRRIFSQYQPSDQPSEADVAVPARSRKEAVPMPGAKPTLAWSKFQEKHQLRIKTNQIPDSEWKKIKALYDDAIAEGRVDYDK